MYRRTVQTTLKASYTGHYRKGLIDLLDVLEFRSTNTAHQPVIEALRLIARYARAGNLTYYPAGEIAPAHRGTTGEWADLVYRPDKHGRRRVVRMVYEVATFQALRDQLRCKEIWVADAGRWRDPDEDLPKDFEARRPEHYASLRKPLDPAEFCGALREEMAAALGKLDEALPRLDWVDIADRPAGAIRLTPLEAAPEPRNLRRIKNEVARRWAAVPLIDVLKETVLRTCCLQGVTSVAGSGTLPAETLAERLMLAIYAYGTNTGIRSVISAAHGHSEEDVRYARRRYLTPEAARTVAIAIADATFATRDRGLWGEGSTAVASDSTHFRSWDQNLFTEWHSRYGGRGVLVYWHVERGSVVVHSQTLRASASEVHAMVEGAIRHGTTMSVEGNYTDTHGQSEIGFGVTRLLNVDLLPRIKRINKVKLYRYAAGDPAAYPRLAPALTRPIRWDLIGANYDQVIKYATAIKDGTATTEAVLSRFTRTATHPAYQAMLEIGRAQKTIFVARYLRDRELRREIEEGLNMVEAWNGANAVICYGRGGDISTNRSRRGRDDRAVPADPASRPGLRQHPHAAGRPGRRGLVRAARRGRPPRPDPAVLAACAALRGGPAGHGITAADRRIRLACRPASWSEQRLAPGGGSTAHSARRPGGRGGLERGLRGLRVDDDVPAEQHAADDLPGVPGRVLRVRSHVSPPC